MAKKIALVIAFIVMCSNSFVSADTIKITGDILQVVLPATTMAVTYAKKDTKGIKQFIAGYSAGMGTSHLLKLGDLSSGHTTSVFASAEFLRKRYGSWYGIPAYGLAAFTGYSRVESDKHSIWEVLVGAGVGVGSSYVFTDSFEVKPYKCGALISIEW